MADPKDPKLDPSFKVPMAQISKLFKRLLFQRFPVLHRFEEDPKRAVFLWGTQQGAAALLGRFGYELETRRSGEFRLGFWKKRIRKAEAPRRLVLIPGWGDSPVTWLGVLFRARKWLAQNFDEIVLVEFPGFHGALALDRSVHDLHLLISNLNQALSSLSPHTVWGHSLGGWLAAAYSLHATEFKANPPRLLVLMNSAGIFGKGELRGQWEEHFEKLSAEEYAGFVKAIFADRPFWMRFVEHQVQAFFKEEEVQLFARSMSPDRSLDGKASQILSRVQLVWGDRDELLPPRLVSLWKEELGPEQPEPILLSGVGHTPHLESPAKLVKVLQEIQQREAGLPAI